jgi:hypothetical protein
LNKSKESRIQKLEKIEKYLRDETDDEEERVFDLVEVRSIKPFGLADVLDLNLQVKKKIEREMNIIEKTGASY